MLSDLCGDPAQYVLNPLVVSFRNSRSDGKAQGDVGNIVMT